MPLQSILHMLFPKRCVRKAMWVEGVLRCPCGQVVAMRYQVGQRTATFVLPQFSRMREEIISKGKLSGSQEVIGAISFDDFDAAVRSLSPLCAGHELEEDAAEDEENEEPVEEDT